MLKPSAHYDSLSQGLKPYWRDDYACRTDLIATIILDLMIWSGGGGSDFREAYKRACNMAAAQYLELLG